MTEATEPAETWLEFHDLEIDEATWDGANLTLRFDHVAVFTADYAMYGDRAGEIILYDATAPALPRDDDEIPWVSTGAWQSGDARGKSMLPVAGLRPESGRVKLRLSFNGWQEWEAEAASLRVVFTAYSEPSWAIFPAQMRKYYGQETNRKSRKARNRHGR